MRGLQILLVNTLVAVTVAQLGNSNFTRNNFSARDSRGGHPFPHSYRRRRSSESISVVSNSELQSYGGYYAAKENSSSSGRNSEMGALSITSGSVDTEVHHPDNHSSRQRRNSATGFGNVNRASSFRPGTFREVSLDTRNNWPSRTNGVSTRTDIRTTSSNLDQFRGGFGNGNRASTFRPNTFRDVSLDTRNNWSSRPNGVSTRTDIRTTSSNLDQSGGGFGNVNGAPTSRPDTFREVPTETPNNWPSRPSGGTTQTDMRTRPSSLDHSRGGSAFPHSCRRRRSNNNSK